MKTVHAFAAAHRLIPPQAQSSCRHLLLCAISENSKNSAHSQLHNKLSQQNSHFNLIFIFITARDHVLSHVRTTAVVPHWATFCTPCKKHTQYSTHRTTDLCCPSIPAVACPIIPSTQRRKMKSNVSEYTNLTTCVRLCTTPVSPARTSPLLLDVPNDVLKTNKMRQVTRLKNSRCVK